MVRRLLLQSAVLVFLLHIALCGGWYDPREHTAHPVLVFLGLMVDLGTSLPKDPEALKRLEKEEMQFAQSSLKREMEYVNKGATVPGGDMENVIRRAYRKMALRYRKNIFQDTDKFEFQMRILNLARDALMRGETLGSDGGDEDEEAEPAGPGRELPPGNRMSEDILKQIYHWQELGLEEGVRFDDLSLPFFVGHTQHAFNAAYEANWTQFVRDELAELWPAMGALRLQVELSGQGSSGGNRGNAVQVNTTVRKLTRHTLTLVLNSLHACGAKSPPLAGYLPTDDDVRGWVELHLKASSNLRSLFGSGPRPAGFPQACVEGADRDARLAILEINLQALEELGSAQGDGYGNPAVAKEIQLAHDVVLAVRKEPSPAHCRDIAGHKRGVIDMLWEEYQFGALIGEAYPLDACSLQGLESFLEFHSGANGELLSRKAEPDRSILRAVRGLAGLQRALLRPAALDTGAWRDAVGDVQNAVWQGLAFPELHDAAGRLMAEIANAGLLPDVLEVMLEHPPLRMTPEGVTMRHGREPGDAQPARDRIFGTLDVPGYSLKPIQRFEDKAIALWGDEEEEENWDPVRLGLAYLDLTSACEIPLQVAACFLTAALWFWRALQLLGDRCGGDGWLEIYIFEDLWSVSPESKRLAMQFGLKRAIFELIDYASLMADHNLLAGARLWVQRTAYLLILKVTSRFGAAEDAPRVLTHLRRLLLSARLNPFWTPPVTQVADTVFVDILGGRLHQAFLEGLYQASGLPAEHEGGFGAVVPSAVLEYSIYEAALLGAGDGTNLTYARFDVMEALLQDSGRQWDDIESTLTPAPLPLDPAGFVAGWPAMPSAFEGAPNEFVALRGIRMDLQTGKATVLLARPTGTAFPLLALSDVPGILSVEDPNAFFLSLDPAAASRSGKQFPHHPFQHGFVGIPGIDRRSELTLLHTALTLQQIAAGTEVAMRAPFPLRRCSDGMCRGLPVAANVQLQPLASVPGEQWDVPSRLMLECTRVPYRQRFKDNALEVLFGEPVLEVHPGKPLQMLNEETFKTWSVAKLRQVLRRLEGPSAAAEDGEAALPVIEKSELVNRLLKLVEDGRLIEDDEEGDAMARFARRFTHHLPSILAHWPHLARVGPLCALRAAGLVLRNQLQQMNESAQEQRAAVRGDADAHLQGLREQQAEGWRRALGDVHAQALRELGFVDFDPGQCWGDGESFSFARCCSVGDNVARCFPKDEDNPLSHSWAAEQSRCCGAAVGRTGFNTQLVAAVSAQLGMASSRRPRPEVLMPVVSSWLKDPAGVTEDGKTLSGKVIDLLVEEVEQEDVLRNTEDQLQRPVNKLAADLEALAPQEPGRLPVIDSAQYESWLPLPPLFASGGRRALFTTVAFTPQLQQLSEEQAEAEERKSSGPVEEVALEDLGRSGALMSRGGSQAASASSSSADVELRVLQESAALLRSLDESTTTGKWRIKAAGWDASQASEDTSCSLEGWRQLRPAKVASTLGFGDTVRIRHRDAEDVVGEVGVVKNILSVTSAPGDLSMLWELAMGSGTSQFFKFEDESVIVSVPCTLPSTQGSASFQDDLMNESVEDPVEQSEASSTTWPDCIKSNQASPSFSGTGLFVNLAVFNISEGCFLDNCEHTDHFACSTPAACARTCAKVSACRLWTFWESSQATCWLRNDSSQLEELMGAVSATSACLPPSEEVSQLASTIKPTLFELVSGATGTPPASLWDEWDMVGVLEEFGHMTTEQVRRAPPSERQRTALRIAARATSRCASSWQGCT